MSLARITFGQSFKHIVLGELARLTDSVRWLGVQKSSAIVAALPPPTEEELAQPFDPTDENTVWRWASGFWDWRRR